VHAVSFAVFWILSVGGLCDKAQDAPGKILFLLHLQVERRNFTFV
jgi:hypothetical protein